MTFAAIVTCHNSVPWPILDCLAGQSRPPDDTLVGWSGERDTTSSPPRDSNVDIWDWPDDNDYGYSKRNGLAEKTKCDYIGFFNHDDSYHPKYIEKMMGAVKETGADVVWCWANEFPRTEFQPCHTGVGNFIIRRELFLDKGGFQPAVLGRKSLISPAVPDVRFVIEDNPGFYDALLIERLRDDIQVKKVCVPTTMYYHNIPFDSRIRATNWGVIR